MILYYLLLIGVCAVVVPWALRRLATPVVRAYERRVGNEESQ